MTNKALGAHDNLFFHQIRFISSLGGCYSCAIHRSAFCIGVHVYIAIIVSCSNVYASFRLVRFISSK